MLRRTFNRIGQVLSICAALSCCGCEQATMARGAPEQIALHEAEILIFLLPASRETVDRGEKIGWELQTTPAINQEDYFVFSVYNASHPEAPSVTLGFFAVNKHTVDVWDEGLENLVVDRELQGIQDILRRARGIDAGTIEKYRSRSYSTATENMRKKAAPKK